MTISDNFPSPTAADAPVTYISENYWLQIRREGSRIKFYCPKCKKLVHERSIDEKAAYIPLFAAIKKHLAGCSPFLYNEVFIDL